MKRWLVVLGIAGIILSTALPGAASAHRSLAAPPALVFTFPSSGAVYPSNGPYLFQVQPVTGAMAYLWSFVQGGAIVYQNLDRAGHLSSATYTVALNSAAHNAIQAGVLHVRVRALMKDGTWSASAEVMIMIQGKASTPGTPHPASGVLYQATKSVGFNNWHGSSDWKVIYGLLINDGPGERTSYIIAPYRPKRTDYAVEAQIQVVDGCDTHDILVQFGLVGRLTPGLNPNGYWSVVACNGIAVLTKGSITAGAEMAERKPYTVGLQWHTYRLEVHGNAIRYLIDGILVAEDSSDLYQSSGRVGLWRVGDIKINIRSFRVLAL